MIAWMMEHTTMILTIALTISELLAFIFPNATGIMKAISLLKGAGAKGIEQK